MLKEKTLVKIECTGSTHDGLQAIIRHIPNIIFEFVAAMSYFYENNERGPLIIRANELAKEVEEVACSCESCTQWPDEWFPHIVNANMSEILDVMKEVFSSYGINFWVLQDGTDDPYVFFYDENPLEELKDYMEDIDYSY